MLGKFIDKLAIDVASGTGGDGIVSFNRTRTRQLPDGGNGGQGGNVYLVGSDKHHGLGHLQRTRWNAAHGCTGQTANKTGENGAALDIPVPIGTQVYERRSGNLLLAIAAPQRYLLAAGGKAGFGNASHPHPRTKGEEGTKLALLLDHHLQADVALVGSTNSGKSTLLNRMSSAKAKVAAYPFTTQAPQLGSCDLSEQYEPALSIVEIPSHRFADHLKHLRHCHTIVYVVTGQHEHYADQLQPLLTTLHEHNPALLQKHAIIAATHCDEGINLPPRIPVMGRMLPVFMVDTDLHTFTRKLFQLCQTR